MPNTPFHEVLDERRSVRGLGPLGREQLSTLLWHGARTRTRIDPASEHRAAPAAGGLHVHHLVIVEPPDADAWLYDPRRHALHLIDWDSRTVHTAAQAARAAGRDARNQATLIFAAADPAMLDNAYENSASLLWRDAGCLLATVHLVATWQRLGSCVLGLLDGGLLDGARAPLTPTGALICGSTA